MAEGIIYVLTNEAMPGFVKVGKTMTSVAQRIRELDNTSLPFPFECFYAARVADMDRAERLVHDAFADYRRNPRREFFEIDPERVRSALKLAEIEEVTPTEIEVVSDATDRAAISQARERRANASFDMLDILPGAILTFSKDPAITCTVLDDRQVEFEGEATSLSRSALSVVHRMGYEWPTINGWAYWQYNGKKLSDLLADAQMGE